MARQAPEKGDEHTTYAS